MILIWVQRPPNTVVPPHGVRADGGLADVTVNLWLFWTVSSIRWKSTMLKFISRETFCIFLLLSPHNVIRINAAFWLYINVILGVMRYYWINNLQSHKKYFRGTVSRSINKQVHSCHLLAKWLWKSYMMPLNFCL